MQYKGVNDNNSLLYTFFQGSQKNLDNLNQLNNIILPMIKKKLYKIKPLREEGRPPIDPVLLFKIILIQHLYDLSDRAVLEQITDRISFMRFLGINNPQQLPSKTALVNFRKMFFKTRSPEQIFNKLFKKLKKLGFTVEGGTIIDSKIVEAPGKKSSSGKRRDKHAKYTKKHNTLYFGYKAHTLVNNKNKLILGMQVTPANVNDICMLMPMVKQYRNYITTIFGDKGYSSKTYKPIIEAYGIKYKIMKQPYGKQKLTNQDIKYNDSITKVRARIEHVFGRLVNEFKLIKTRYFTEFKNSMSILFKAALYNIKQARRLKPHLAL